ncbi:alpha/beta hydrolase [bacterium]|nr:alpha/beta hydrolase [bacterium]
MQFIMKFLNFVSIQVIRWVVTLGVLFVTASVLNGQEACKRIMEQDSTINNLVDPPGYKTAMPGTLGGVLRVGSGTQAIILIPGLGFGASIFKDFMDGIANEYRMYAVTLAGFGGTAAPPSPAENTSFGEQTWTLGALNAIEKLIDDEGISNPIIVGHWLTGTQIAVRLAMKHPGRVKSVIILAGAAGIFSNDKPGDPMETQYYGTLEKRVATIDTYLAPQWFKTVTRQTWDDNNFLPGDYAVNPVIGLRLWREAASPQLHVWVRYLCEFNAQDISLEMDKLTVPTLLLQPGLEGISDHPDQKYMKDYCHTSWKGNIENNRKIIAKTIPNSRVCLWFDQPQAVKDAVVAFLKGGIK